MQPLFDPVRISVPALVRLSGIGAGLQLGGGRIRARQGGDYLSPFKGRGMEFSESRPYQPGDDVRNIDWRVTARTGRAHTKIFREERERPVFLSVDFRPSMFFATRGRYKAVAAAHLAGIIGWSAAHQGDRIGGVIYSDAEHHEVKPQRGRRGVLRFIRELVIHPAWQSRGAGAAQPAYAESATTDPATADLAKADPAKAGFRALLRLRRVVRPGSMVFLLSDFHWLDARSARQVGRLAQHNDVVLVFLFDPLERTLPPPGHYRINDGAREMVLDTHDRALVEGHARRFAEREQALGQLARQQGLRLVRYCTDQDPAEALRLGLGGARPRP